MTLISILFFSKKPYWIATALNLADDNLETPRTFLEHLIQWSLNIQLKAFEQNSGFNTLC